jgi:hypothetical protein
MITPDEFIVPLFYDKKVQEINTSLEALAWIEYIHPITQIGVDSEGTFPEVYVNDGTHKSIRVFPHGKAISFFTVDSPVQIDESDMWSVNLSLTVWADLTKVYPDRKYNYTTTLIKEVKGVIDTHGGYDYNIDLANVFADYSQLEKLETQNVMLPYTAFRVNFTVDILMC